MAKSKEEEAPKNDLILKAALVRTLLAAENSMLAWVRTCISLYAFGFSMITFFDYMGKQMNEVHPMIFPIILGFILICVGIISLVLAMREHKKVTKELRRLGLPVLTKFSLPLASTTAFIIIGIFALIAIILYLYLA